MMTKQDTTDLFMLLATFRCFNEQLYTLKGKHKHIVKMKFNRLLNVSRQYENEIVKLIENKDALEDIYDCLMEVILEVKQQVDEQNKTSVA